MLLRVALAGLVAASVFRLSNPINPSVSIAYDAPRDLGESDGHPEWLDAQDISLSAPSTEYLEQRERIESLVSGTIPKLKQSVKDIFSLLFRDLNPESSVLQLDHEIDDLLNLNKLNTDQLTSATNLAKLATQSVYSDRSIRFLDDLLDDINSGEPKIEVAKQINKSMMRSKITAWLEEKKSQFQTIHKTSGVKTQAAFIQITSSDHARSRTPAPLTQRLIKPSNRHRSNPASRFISYLSVIHKKSPRKGVS